MNILLHWKYFQKSDLDFLKLAYKKQHVVADLRDLNERRRDIQREIIALSSTSDACKICPTSCCRGNYNHFTVVDHIIRMFSDNPVREFAEIQKKPPSLLDLAFEKMTKSRLSSNDSRALSFAPSPASASVAGCPDCTPTGCAFMAEDRPIRCVIYTCRAFRRSFSGADIQKIGALTKELSLISAQAFIIFGK